jgi:hypothetical protein
MFPLPLSLLSLLAQMVVFLIFNLEVFSSNLGRDIDYFDYGFSPSSSVPPDLKLVHHRFLTHSFQFIIN